MRDPWKKQPTFGAGHAEESHRTSVYGGPGYQSIGGARVEQVMNFNGSRAFGGAKQWPVVNAHVSLPAGREDLRAKLAELFRDTIDAFLAEHGLTGDEIFNGGSGI